MKAQIVLRWTRRTALAAVLTLFVISQAGILICGKGQWPPESQFQGIISLSGEIAYLRTLDVNPPAEPLLWDRRFVSFSDRLHGGFMWPSLGFYYRHFSSPEFQYRKSQTDSTMITRPAFSSLAIAVPYWPFLVLLAFPELLLILRRAKRRVFESAAPAAATTDAPSDDSLMAADLPCVGCSYNLLTQPRSGRCPECGLPISNTLSLNAELARSRPGWLKSLALGNALLLAVRVVLLAVYTEIFSHGLEAVIPTAIAAGVLYLVGIYFLTLPEHPFFESPHRKRIVRGQRITATCLLVFVAVAAWAQSSISRNAAVSILGIFDGLGYFRALTLELLLYAWLIFCVLVVLEYFYLARLAGRLLDRFMTEHCKIAGIGAAIGGVIVILIVRSIATDRIPWDFVPLILTCAVVIIWQLFVLWAGFMNAYCAVRFLQQAWIAEQRWLRQSEGATIEAAPL